MKIIKVNRAHELSSDWDRIATSIYNRRAFLTHLEKSNFSNQRYYLLYKNELLCAGAVIYSLKINLFTFSNLKLKLPMQVIGLPVSNDQSGLLGKNKDVGTLIKRIFKDETGIILCLNHIHDISNKNLINMWSLPSMIYTIQHDNWLSYINSLRHAYRRRIRKALNKIQSVRITSESCQSFTDDHYNQYLNVVNRSKTKLEVMNKTFFENLPKNFKLRSFYHNDILLFWNITTHDNEICHFLFGGMDYALRDTYDSYTNNLIDVIKEGFRSGCEQINLGQTAETSKARLGAYAQPKRMFLYHRNKFIRQVFKLFKRQLSHANKVRCNNVYKIMEVADNKYATNELMEYKYAEYK